MDEEEQEKGGAEALAKAVAGSSLAKAESSVLDALGGIWGIVTSVIPVVIFVLVLTLTDDLTTTLIASVGAGALVLIVSLLARRPFSQSIGGLIGVLVCALVARTTGRSEDFFALGLLTNLAYALGLSISVLVRYPLIGVVVSALKFSQSTDMAFFAWRSDASLVRRYSLVTWLWVAMFVLRLAIQTPLYLAHLTAYLGTAKLVMGLPLTAVVLWMSWLILRKPAAA